MRDSGARSHDAGGCQDHAAKTKEQAGNEGGEQRTHFVVTMARAAWGVSAAICAWTMAFTGASKICVKLLG